MKTAIGRSAFAGFAALCLLGALPTGGHATETEKSPSDSARPDDFETYVVMSNDAYIEKFGAKKAIAGGLPVSRKEGITAAYNGNADRHPRPTRYEYDAVVATSQGGIRLTVTSVAEQGTYGPGPTGPHTPDGRPIGTVTVFCRGQTVCPDWVNDL